MVIFIICVVFKTCSNNFKLIFFYLGAKACTSITHTPVKKRRSTSEHNMGTILDFGSKCNDLSESSLSLMFILGLLNFFF